MTSIQSKAIAVSKAIDAHIQTRCMQSLMGLVTGIVADSELNEKEVLFLNTWLREHPEVVSHWPGSAIAAWVREVCADGQVTREERELLLHNLSAMVSSDFASTGAVASGPTELPIDDSRPLSMVGAGIVHTGVFLFGTRARCERLSEALGAVPLSTVTKAVHVLVIGTQVSPAWVTESYGRKIMQAMELRTRGSPIQIVSERHWFAHAEAAGKVGAC